jgi:hypothetical protein
MPNKEHQNFHLKNTDSPYQDDDIQHTPTAFSQAESDFQYSYIGFQNEKWNDAKLHAK